MIVIIFVFGVVLSIHNSVFALSVGVLRSTGSVFQRSALSRASLA